LYYAKNVSTDTVSLHTAAAVAAGNIVDITATGSGILRLRKCSGSIYGISTESSGAVTVSDGSKIGYSVTVGVDD
jgi:predicted nuclease with RNAse H fold